MTRVSEDSSPECESLRVIEVTRHVGRRPDGQRLPGRQLNERAHRCPLPQIAGPLRAAAGERHRR